MAKRFVRVHLGEEAVDFRPIAIEPGVPLLDSAGANDKIMFKWLGGLIAEPEWDSDTSSVNFFVRDEQGGRLEEVQVFTIEPQDLQSSLAGDVERIRERLAQAKSSSGAEDMMLKLVRDLFNQIIEDDQYPGRTNFFFKYKDANDNWRLIWAYGYQRIDEEIGKLVVCDDDECGLLYVQRQGQSKRCPGCQALPMTRKKRRDAIKRRIFRSLLLLLLLAFIGWILFNAFLALKVNPFPISVPVGSTVDINVKTPGLFNLGLIMSEDLTEVTKTQVKDTRILHFIDGMTAFAQSPGETEITFYAKNRWKTVKVTVVPPIMPKNLVLEPESAALVVGSTARFKVWGEYEDGSRADLSQACVWNSKNDGTVYHYNGFVEGLAEGNSSISVRYRATAKDTWLDKTAEVQVGTDTFQSLNVAVTPADIPLGQTAKIAVSALTASGTTVTMTGSSLLDYAVEPPLTARFRGDKLVSMNPGSGALKMKLGEISSDCAFRVTEASVLSGLKVAQTEVGMLVDERLPLSISAPAGAPVKVTSKNLKVVGVDSQGNLVGRSAGSAEVVVKCGEDQAVVSVKVTEGKVKAISVFPPEITVPLDHQVPVRLLALSSSGQYFSLSPERMGIDQKPSVRFAELDSELSVKGLEPTPGSQSLIMNYRGTQVSTNVGVIAAPLRLAVTPAGEVKLPLGLCMTFDGWATYGDGVSCRVPYTRISWQADPPKADGFEFRAGKAMALKPGVGPIGIWGSYYGSTSNRTELTTAERADVQLKVEVDRNIRIAGETGRAVVSGYSPSLGDVELVPDIAEFTSSDEKVIKPRNKNSGLYNAVDPGTAVLSASHIAAEKPAAVDLSVVHGRNATLRWEADQVNLAIDQTVSNRLFLDAKLGEDDTITSVEMTTGAQFKSERSDAIYWQAPMITGLAEAEPFKLSASYQPYLRDSAESTITVAGENLPAELRIVGQPSGVKPSAGSSVQLAVEELMAGDSNFRELDPSVVSWDVPSGVYWKPAVDGARPEVTFPADASGTYTIQARYAGKSASLALTVDKSILDPNDPEVVLSVLRFPPGVYVPQGGSQGYAILMTKGNQVELAPNVQWGPNFENEFVTWSSPYVTAQKPGFLQWLNAKVGKRQVRWYVETVDLYAAGAAREREDGQPIAVRLLTDQGQEVSVPVGGKFSDFRVEADFPGGLTKMVTRKAAFHVVSGDKTCASPNNGKIEASKVGTVTYIAEYKGVDSEEKLKVNVVGDVDIDSMKLIPYKGMRLLPGETTTFAVEGFKAGKSIGHLTQFGDVKWQSSDTAIIDAQGPVATAKGLGQASVTAEFKGVTSEPAVIDVVATVEDQLKSDERIVYMRVGESRRIGADIPLYRGNVDFSKQCTVVSGNPSRVRYDAPTHSIVGVAPGDSVISFLMGSQKGTITAVVKGITAEEAKLLKESGTIDIDPANASVSVGQLLDVRIFASAPGGLRLDRTTAAVLTSSNPGVLKIQGMQVMAMAPGQATLSANVPGVAGKGTAAITVDTNPITELVVEPGTLQMSAGDTMNLFIQGRSASGLRSLYAQPALQVTSSSPAAAVDGIRSVRGVSAGSANIDVKFNQLAKQVPVTVTDDPYMNLKIEPAAVTIAKGESLIFQVTATRGGRLHVLRPENGLKVFTADPNIARFVPTDMAAVGVNEGRTTLTAEMGSLKTDASITVVPPGTTGAPLNDPTAVDGVGFGRTFVDEDGDGRLIEEVAYGDGDGVVDVWQGDGHNGDGIADGTYGHGGVNQPGYEGPVDEVYDDYNNYTGSLDDLAVDTVGAGTVSALKFVPETARVDLNGGGVPIEVYELLSDGSLGRNVTTDPALQITTPRNAKWETATGGGRRLVPTAEGESAATATLGELKSLSPLFVQVGDFPQGTGTLVVTPQTVDLWVGESTKLDSVMIAPDNGLMPFDIAYRLTAVDATGAIAVDADNTIRGVSQGIADVRVETVDPSGPNDKRSVFVRVNVTPPQQYTITPADVSLQIGQTTPPFTVTATDPATGSSFAAVATLVPGDPSILEPDPADPNRFIARTMGSTQLQAMVRGRAVGLATVRVAGERFLDVRDSGIVDAGDTFTVNLTAMGSANEGALEYRVYQQGTTPAENWTPAVTSGNSQMASLASPAIPIGGRDAQYTLILEARKVGDTAVQQYPFNFRLASKFQVERIGN